MSYPVQVLIDHMSSADMAKVFKLEKWADIQLLDR